MTTDEDNAVWVVGIDYGHEGKLAPFTWARSEDVAAGIVESMKKTGTVGVYCARVPMFPEVSHDD